MQVLEDWSVRLFLKLSMLTRNAVLQQVQFTNMGCFLLQEVHISSRLVCRRTECLRHINGLQDSGIHP